VKVQVAGFLERGILVETRKDQQKYPSNCKKEKSNISKNSNK
jgi:hypothetical protein